jgi:hypothetical protein
MAFREAVTEVIAEHKRLGLPLVIWRDGRVVRISAEEVEAELQHPPPLSTWPPHEQTDSSADV